MMDLKSAAIAAITQADLPDHEQRGKHIILSNLTRITIYVQRFAAAIALYDLCDPASPNPGMPQDHINILRIMAGDDGAMTIWHIGNLISALRDFKDAPSLSKRVRHDELKTAQSLHKSHFPSFEEVRHASAHSSQLYSRSDKIETNVPSGEFETPIGKMRSGDGGLIIVSGSFFNRTYFSTINRNVVSYDLSPENHRKLERVVELIYSAFAAGS